MKTIKNAILASAVALVGSFSANAGLISVDATVRDFSFSHPDFQNFGANGSGLTRGLVETQLGIDGKPVYVGGRTMSTEANFNQWFNDVPGVNQAFTVSLEATESMPGLYTYNNTAYFPVDGLGFGNEGRTNNYSFTTQINTFFTYTGFTSQVEDFSFRGDDDVWVFINGELVIDLGGIHGPVDGGIDIDTLGLSLGETYSLDIFQVERQTSGSNFSFTTAAAFRPDANVTEVSAPGTLLLMALSIVGLIASARARINW